MKKKKLKSYGQVAFEIDNPGSESSWRDMDETFKKVYACAANKLIREFKKRNNLKGRFK